MANIAVWLSLTTLWALLLVFVKPLLAYARWSVRILGLPDYGDPLIIRVLARGVLAVGVLACSLGVVGAVGEVLQR